MAASFFVKNKYQMSKGISNDLQKTCNSLRPTTIPIPSPPNYRIHTKSQAFFSFSYILSLINWAKT